MSYETKCAECRAKEQKEMAARKSELLAHYAGREPHLYHQYDGWLDVDTGDSIVVPDSDRDALTGTDSWELRSGGIAVRVQIEDGTSKGDAVRLLKKILGWVKRDYGSSRPEPF
jgi:hypothetical protein